MNVIETAAKLKVAQDAICEITKDLRSRLDVADGSDALAEQLWRVQKLVRIAQDALNFAHSELTR